MSARVTPPRIWWWGHRAAAAAERERRLRAELADTHAQLVEAAVVEQALRLQLRIARAQRDALSAAAPPGSLTTIPELIRRARRARRP